MGKNVKLIDEKAEEEKKRAKEQRELKKKEQKKKEVTISTDENFRGLVRLAEKDIPGNTKLRMALCQVAGVGQTLSQAFAKISGFNPDAKIGDMSEIDIKKLDEIIKNPSKFNVPDFMLNKRKEVQDAISRHVIASDLIVSRRSDIDLKKKIRCYQGVRHELGQPCRGQRTRSTFRVKGRAVGVQRQKQAPAKAGEKKEEKK